MKTQLWVTCCHVSHEESVDQMAQSVFKKIYKKIRTFAGWGYADVAIFLPELKLFKFIHPDLHETVRTRALNLFKEQSFAIKDVDGLWYISWRPSESKVPRLTSRDLIQAGYNPAHGTLFKDILQGLRTAILKEEVSNDTLQANLIWVKENFPLI